MDEIAARMRQDAFAQHLGIELVELEPGRAEVRMAIGDEHRNSVGMAHGGVIFTLADYAFAAASNSHGTVAVAVNVSIAYLQPPSGGTLEAEATEVSRSRRLGTYDVTVHDGEGSIVAVFRGMAYRKDTPLSEAPR